jgi:BCD family chlorophyll transporter-like MFS transporter
MRIKRFQLGLIHVAVAITLVPINSTLNRVMIHDLALSATVVAILASLPYLFAPMQVALGAYSDRHPVLGFRRTPYILLGLLLCVAGLIISPQVAFLMAGSGPAGYLVAALAFGAWGMGYNISSVSYLSLAAELSGEKERGKTIATMWFMMIVAIIITAIGVGRMLDPYSPAALERAFWAVGMAALLLGLVGVVKLEPRHRADAAQPGENFGLREMLAPIMNSPQARLFFVYLFLLLAAILGQDVLLEPYAAQAFGLSVSQTTRITSIWGTAVLAAIILAGALDARWNRRRVAQGGNIGALLGFLLIIASGMTASRSVFYSGVTLLGFGTGISTVANLALMFELTLPGSVGLFIGAWGIANAMSRLAGNLLSGVVRDVATALSGNAIFGYLLVFGLEAAMLVAAIFLFTRLDVSSFHRQVQEPDIYERIGVMSD